MSAALGITGFAPTALAASKTEIKVGTATWSSVRKYLHRQKVPQLFVLRDKPGAKVAIPHQFDDDDGKGYLRDLKAGRGAQATATRPGGRTGAGPAR